MRTGVRSGALLQYPPPLGVRGITFRERLQELMQEAEWTIEATAKASGLTYNTVKSYLLRGEGRRLPNLQSAVALARAFRKSVAVFEDCEDITNLKSQKDAPKGDTQND